MANHELSGFRKVHKKILELLPNTGTEFRNIEVTGVSVDSRLTKPGHLFFGLPGEKLHGAEFITYAQRMGAAIAVTDLDGQKLLKKDFPEVKIPIYVVDDPRIAVSEAAANWYVLQPKHMMAVTGTNGKTSVSNFIRQIWESLGEKAVNFGTAGVEGAVSMPLQHTTPEPITLHALLAELAKNGVTHAAMEASSHGLSQHRLDNVKLEVGGFTNLTRDHLDYHHSFENYLEAKLGLVNRVLPETAKFIVNNDDPYGKIFIKTAKIRGIETWRLGTNVQDDLQILKTRFYNTGQDVQFTWRGKPYLVTLDLIGGFQAENALLAAVMTVAGGADPDAVFSTLSQLKTVTGRMQLAASRANGASIFVDYAHTPDALSTALKAIRPHVMGRVFVVFGAGGDRDKGKRPLMGKAAKENADVLYVTDDNPRGERAEDIRAQIMAACQNANEIGDRAQAILTAIDALKDGDALLIAGKGHETGQIVGDDILPFSDIEQASVSVRALENLGV